MPVQGRKTTTHVLITVFGLLSPAINPQTTGWQQPADAAVWDIRRSQLPDYAVSRNTQSRVDGGMARAGLRG